jgi:hypothetical protein
MESGLFGGLADLRFSFLEEMGAYHRRSREDGNL